MKYLKTFETTKKYFKIGDIVTVIDDIRNFYRKQTGEIVSDCTDYIYYDYCVNFNGVEEPILFAKYDIIPATTKEIEKYKLEKNINKYNL
jgi:hypothetical protein